MINTYYLKQSYDIKKIAIFITLTFYALNVTAQFALIKKDVIGNDTVIWETDTRNISETSGAYNKFRVYVAGDNKNRPSVTEDDHTSYYIKKRAGFIDHDIPGIIFDEFTIKELQVLLQSKERIPMAVFVNLDSTGDLCNYFYISKNLTSEFTSSVIYRIRNSLKRKFEFQNDPNYTKYDYYSNGIMTYKKAILKYFQEILDKYKETEEK